MIIADGNDVNYFRVALVQLPVHGCPGRLETEMDKREMKESSDELNTPKNVHSFYTH